MRLLWKVLVLAVLFGLMGPSKSKVRRVHLQVEVDPAEVEMDVNMRGRVSWRARFGRRRIVGDPRSPE